VTASRLRGRIERVLDAAKAKGLRSGENPARWRGHLDHLLPRPPKLEQPHLTAVPYADVPAFMGELRRCEGVAARALEFAILTGARTSEVRLARREEIDLKAGIWTVPASRMKGGREHVVPLSDRAVELARVSMHLGSGEFVFSGDRPDKPFGPVGLRRVLHRLSYAVTVHGFRSSFRDWAGDETNYPREVVEAALAHVIPNATEAASRRSSALEKRRRLMEEWANYCASTNALSIVVAFPSGR
jgi:integrase